MKLLICAPDAATFGEVAEVFREHGDLFVYGRGFALTMERRTDLIPWSEKLLIPPHIRVAGFKSAPKPADAHKALLHALRDEVYILIPFDDSVVSRFGTRICAFGRKMRLPQEIEGLMLETSSDDLIANKRICLPLGEKKTPDLLRIMAVAWENGMVPVFVRRLPNSDRVVAECDVSFELSRPATIGRSSDAIRVPRDLWLRLVACDGDRATVSRLAGEFTMLRHPSDRAVTQVRLFFLRFPVGGQSVVHPALVMKQ